MSTSPTVLDTTETPASERTRAGPDPSTPSASAAIATAPIASARSSVERIASPSPAAARSASNRPGTLARVFGNLWPPLLVTAIVLGGWHLAVVTSGTLFFPTPWKVALGVAQLAREGRLLKYIVSSLYRVTWGFGLALVIGIPFGLLMGWFGRMFAAFNPIIQVLRPISPIAWIPIAILWFGVTDLSPIFLIFLASLFPITVSATAAVRNIQPVYVRAARNFGLGTVAVFTRVIIPATLPQIITAVRIALGVAWLVSVAAEMVVTDPDVGGLGYLIYDARNSGMRVDLVVAGMLLIGLIGLGLDLGIRQLEKFDEVRWGYANR